MAIQDWGYNYLYLRHDGVTTRVNLSTHEYRDVAKLPVAGFELATTSQKGSSVGDEVEDSFWLFEAEAMSQNVHQATLTNEQIEKFKGLEKIIERMLHKSGCIYWPQLILVPFLQPHVSVMKTDMM